MLICSSLSHSLSVILCSGASRKQSNITIAKYTEFQPNNIAHPNKYIDAILYTP